MKVVSMTRLTSSHRPLILGLDGGATKTAALLATIDGEIIGRAHGPGSNLHALGRDAAIAALDQVVTAVFRSAALPQQQVAGACFGMAGVDRPADRALIRAWASAWGLHDDLLVVNDAHLIIAAGTPDGWGVGIICGTGSIAVGRTALGEMARSGGWGYLLGDEGSGYDIAARALRAVTTAADGRAQATMLTDALLRHWGLDQPESLIEHVYALSDPRAQLAELPPLIVNAAERGDSVAVRILEAAGRDLAQAALAVAERLGLHDPIPIAVSGSVVNNAPIIQRALCATLEERGRRVRQLTMVSEPAIGAIRLAREAALAGAALR